MHLSTEVLRHIARVRRSPAAAVDPTELEQLEEAARRGLSTQVWAEKLTPVANHTWMVRTVLRAADESAEPLIIALGEPVVIVGFTGSLLVLNGVNLPAAIDVELSANRGKRNFTGRAERNVAAGETSTVVNLPMLGAFGAEESHERHWWIEMTEADPNFTVAFRWAVDAATRTTLGLGDVQISLGLIVRPLGER